MTGFPTHLVILTVTKNCLDTPRGGAIANEIKNKAEHFTASKKHNSPTKTCRDRKPRGTFQCKPMDLEAVDAARHVSIKADVELKLPRRPRRSLHISIGNNSSRRYKD